jgi:hypothetical protein
MNGRMQDFWRTVRKCFPQARHIILGDDQNRSDYDDGQLPPEAYRKVGKTCPVDVRVSVDLIQGDGSTTNRMERVLWQLTSTQEDASTEASQEWKLRPIRNEPSITLPRKASHGPMGRLLDHHILCNDITFRNRAIRIYRITATEKLHFDGLHEPFACPAPACDAYFDQAEDYTTHVVSTRHDKREGQYDLPELPESIEKLFAKNQERLNHLTAVARANENSFLK